jgi:tripartite-type tricarboxylate transporter receptor subunit TctC
MEDSPPIAETLPGFNFEGWFAVVAPAGTPRDVITRLSLAINVVLNDPEAGARLSELGCAPNKGGTPESAAVFLERERELWRGIVQELGIKPQ